MEVGVAVATPKAELIAEMNDHLLAGIYGRLAMSRCALWNPSTTIRISSVIILILHMRKLRLSYHAAKLVFVLRTF